MGGRARLIPSFTAAQAAAFRAARHHLQGRAPSSLAAVCRDTGGIQAQVMSAAGIGMWTRRRKTTREEISAALWERREIVRTSCMRLTLHLIPAEDLSAYVAATRPSALARLQPVFQKIGARPSHVSAMTDIVLDALGSGPRTQAELVALARARAGRGMKTWLKHSWIPVRPAVIEGLIVYGPSRGGQATFIRTDQWLPPQPAVGLEEARAMLMRRFLGAYGPATARDFAKWSGIRSGEAAAALESVGADAVQVSVDGAPSWLLGRDIAAMERSEIDDAPRFLPGFDSFLLAHATKAHLVEERFYKRVYRNQGWISPVILQRGRIIGVWFMRTNGQRRVLEAGLFGRASASTRQGIEREGEALGRFLGAVCDVRFSNG